jgi:hypothetical protein
MFLWEINQTRQKAKTPDTNKHLILETALQLRRANSGI